jgi:addiction module RelE/StbE family toxin
MVKAVKWSKSAQKQLKNLYNFILEDSFQNAVKVKTDILWSTKILSSDFDKFPIDKYRIIKNGNFRAYEIHNYRISYEIKDKDVLILKIRHNKRKPVYR